MPDAVPTRRRGRVYVTKSVAPFLFLLPFMALFVAFLIAPLAYALGLSLFKTTLVAGTQFVGAANYIKVFTDQSFWDGVILLFQFALMQIPIMLGLALIYALILDSGRVYGCGFFRVAFFIPYAVPSVIAALLWGYLYGPSFGPFGQLAEFFHLPKPQFLIDSTILGSIANIAVWEFMGYNLIIYFAALQAIPQDLEEASSVDGATGLQYALRIKLPMILPTVIVTIMFSIIGTLQLFSEPYLMRTLAPGIINSHYTPNFYAYTLAFTNQQYNYSAAVSFVLGGVVAVASYAFMFFANRRSAA